MDSARARRQPDEHGANEFNAIIDASGGFVASVVEGKMRWMTPLGPGKPVTGTWEFIRTGDRFILAPKNRFSAAGPSGMQQSRDPTQ